MGEIKSALELAMERSKKIMISDSEREAIKEKEVLQRATGLFHRYLGGHFSIREVQKEIERMDETTGTRVKEALLIQWIDCLSPGEEGDRILKGIEALKNRSLDDVRVRFAELGSQRQVEREKIAQQVKDQIVEDLRRAGIRGSAVEPNINGNEKMKELLRTLDIAYQKRLDPFREDLKKNL